ncbi:MAG: GntR family transcriptional regulator [Steroidobacteraceae bacterium]
MPRYADIAEDLIGRIRRGDLAPGSTLPGELTLMDEYQSSRHTIRDALRRLEELGLIERRRGIGTRVLAADPVRSYVHRVRSPAELLQYPNGSRLAVTAVAGVTADAGLARLAGVPAGSRWRRVSAVRRMPGNEPPICSLDLYLRPRYADVAELVGRRRELVYELVERRHGVHVAEVTVDILARPMPDCAAAVLKVEPGSPSMTVVRRYLDEAGDFIQWSVSEHPGERYAYSQSLRRSWGRGADGWEPA